MSAAFHSTTPLCSIPRGHAAQGNAVGEEGIDTGRTLPPKPVRRGPADRRDLLSRKWRRRLGDAVRGHARPLDRRLALRFGPMPALARRQSFETCFRSPGVDVFPTTPLQVIGVKIEMITDSGPRMSPLAAPCEKTHGLEVVNRIQWFGLNVILGLKNDGDP